MEESSNGAENTMNKIKITSKEKEYEGSVEEKVVTPFGNSAHINVGRKHSGKFLPIIIPAKPEYAWVLPEADLKEAVKRCKELSNKNPNGREEHYELGIIDNIQEKRFSLEDLKRIIAILGQDFKNTPLVKRIKSAYNL